MKYPQVVMRSQDSVHLCPEVRMGAKRPETEPFRYRVLGIHMYKDGTLTPHGRRYVVEQVQRDAERSGKCLCVFFAADDVVHVGGMDGCDLCGKVRLAAVLPIRQELA